MIEPPFMELLHRITKRISNQNIEWALTGSTNFALQGLPFTPNDIDIQTNEEGAYQIERLFNEYLIRQVAPLSNGFIKSHFGKLEINGIAIEIMGDLEKLVDGVWEKSPYIHQIKHFVEVENTRFPVLTLEYEAQAYRKLGRIDKAEILLEYIN